MLQVMAAFSILALALASIGVYGVMNYSITHRTREMGFRMALGATPSGVFKLVLTETVVLMAVGFGTGCLFGVGAGRLVAHELVVAPSGPITAVVCYPVMLITGLIASYLPAHRAAWARWLQSGSNSSFLAPILSGRYVSGLSDSRRLRFASFLDTPKLASWFRSHVAIREILCDHSGQR
jgi:hypothetical protein